MLKINPMNIVSTLRTQGTEVAAESIIATAIAYAAAIAPVGKTDLSIFFIHNILIPAREVIIAVNEHHVIDTNLTEELVKQVWLYRMGTINKPPMGTCPSLESWTDACWDTLKDLDVIMRTQFSVGA